MPKYECKKERDKRNKKLQPFYYQKNRKIQFSRLQNFHKL